MPIKTKPELKVYYERGSRASESQWFDLIDSLFNILDDGDELVPHEYQNVLYVDAASTVTGVVGDITNPYANPNLAQADADSGDLIVIFPGSYSVDNLFKAGVSYFAFPGVTLTNAGNSIGGGPPAFFHDFAPIPAGECTLRGFADLIDDDFIVFLFQTGSKVSIQCNTSTRGAVASPGLAGDADAEILFEAKRITHGGGAPFAVANIPFKIKADFAETTSSGSMTPFISVSSDSTARVFEVEIKKIVANNYPVLGAAPIISLSSSGGDAGSCVVRNTTIETSTIRLVQVFTNENGFLLDNVRFVTTSEAISIGMISLPTSGTGTRTFKAKNTELILNGTDIGQQSITGQNDLQVLGTLTTNVPKDPNSIIKVGEFNQDTDLKV